VYVVNFFLILLADEREVTEANPVSIPLCPPHIPNGMAHDMRGYGLNFFMNLQIF